MFSCFSWGFGAIVPIRSTASDDLSGHCSSLAFICLRPAVSGPPGASTIMMWQLRDVRTTLEVDDVVLSVARELAREQHTSIGAVISTLARAGLRPASVGVADGLRRSRPPPPHRPSPLRW